MQQHERSRSEGERLPQGPPSGASSRSRGDLERADSLVAAGDDAISRVLSQGSEEFLASLRQEGGE